MGYHPIGKGFPESKLTKSKSYYRLDGVSIKSLVYNRDDGRCMYCRKILAPSNFTLDHILPRSRGGSNKIDNLATCCNECNTAKGHKLLLEFILSREGWFKGRTFGLMLRREHLRKEAEKIQKQIYYLDRAIKEGS